MSNNKRKRRRNQKATGRSPAKRQPPRQKAEPGQDQKQMAMFQMEQVTHHSGPIPAPDDLMAYDQVSPGLADRIVAMAEKEQEHRHVMETKWLGGGQTRSWAGLLAGFIVAIVALLVAGWVAVEGNPIAGAVIGTVDLAALVYVFVVGRNDQQQQLNQ